MSQVKPRKGYKFAECSFDKYEEIPDGWTILPLEQLCLKMKSGGTPKSNEKPYYNGKISFASIADITFSKKYLIKTTKTITKNGLDNSNAWIIPKNSLLFSMYATVGKPLINKIETTTHQGILGIIVNEKINNEFLFYILQFMRKMLLRYVITNTQSNINLQISKNLKIIHPQKLQEQQKIASILSNVDILIENTQGIIDVSIKLKKGLMQKLLTKGIGHTKFRKIKFIFGKHEDIPREWNIKKFDDIFEFLITGTNPRNDLGKTGTICYIHYGDIHTKWKLILDCSSQEIPRISKAKVEKIPFLKEGDLIIVDVSEDHNGSGTSILLKNVDDNKIISGLHTFALRNKNENVSLDFKTYITSIKFVKSQIISRVTGISVYGLSKNNLKNIKIPLPQLKEQQKIGSILSNVDSLIQLQKNNKDKLERLKKSLMQKLLTGEVRVKI